VTVAYEIARTLRCPLDILIVRKIGFPGDPELAVGAVSETGSVVSGKLTPFRSESFPPLSRDHRRCEHVAVCN
jgi:putative phosphoribosyl transferase